jgi:beta-galactosidase
MGKTRLASRPQISYNHCMKLPLLSIVLLVFSAGAVLADRPPVVAISSMTGVSVKITDAAPYKPDADVSYQISHWPDGAVLASGTIPALAIKTDAWGLHGFSVEGLSPRLWSPRDPQLYEITLSQPGGHELGKARFGFRTFEAKGNKLYLNGRPTFLRGVPINPPGRDIPPATEHDQQFIRGYIKLLRSAGVNMIRTEPQDWLDACDELGMMLFAGHYGGAGGSGPDAPALEKAQPFYRDLVLSLASHPGVVIYVLTNEVDYKSPTSTYKQFLTKVREDIRSVDPTRPVIANAGFGHGQPGEIFDVHRYAGWYYGSLCDWYADNSIYLAEAEKSNQPYTMTECVGAYTSDAGDFETMSKQLCTMTKWVGTAKDPRAAAGAYQAELVKQVVECSRRYRTDKSSIAGVMPFTYLLGWANAKKAEDIIIKPAFEMLKVVFQPVLLSPECWRRDLYSGDVFKTRLCLVNDDDLGRDIGPSRALVDITSSDGTVVASGSAEFPATPHYSNSWTDLSIPVPANLPRGYYDVRCNLIENGAQISHNSFQISIAPKAWVKAASVSVTLYDPSGDTARALKQVGVEFTSVADIHAMPKRGVLVIGEEAGSYPDKKSALAFLGRGGRILCLRQDKAKWNGAWLPARFVIDRSRRAFSYIQPVGSNASIMNGLTDRDLRYWNALGRSADTTPDIGPVLTALKPASVKDLRSARVWAACDQLLSGAAIVEMFHGSGRIILSQFRIVERVNDDPIAAKLLGNLIAYASGKSAGLLDLTRPIRWDLAAFRAGAFVSPLQGFLPHSKTYRHEGNSKGRLGDDHRIDGFTLVGNYGFTSNGWLTPIPDPAADGWGILYGTLSRPATKFTLKLSNPGDTPAKIGLELDEKTVSSITVPAGVQQSIQWPITRVPGPVTVELRGDQRFWSLPKAVSSRGEAFAAKPCHFRNSHLQMLRPYGGLICPGAARLPSAAPFSMPVMRIAESFACFQ